MRLRFACALVLLVALSAPALAETVRGGTVTYTVDVQAAADAQNVRLWLPYPLSDANQDISDVRLGGNFEQSGVYRDPASGAVSLYAQWKEPKEQPKLTLSFHVDSHYAKLPRLVDNGGPIPVEVVPYLKQVGLTPQDEKSFAAMAKEATKGRKGTLAKARGVYEWVIAHTYRDNDVVGCGLGQPGRTLSSCNGGGKCADISSVFVAVARAAGIPCRDVYGLRMAAPKTGTITGDYHCWVEFYLPGTGWVPVDPADVRKMMLVNKLELKDAKQWVEFFWGGDDLFRIALERGTTDVTLAPKQAGPPLTYYMYPFAQVDGRTLDFFSPKTFAYTVEFKAD
ncbi:transglutaminase-like domain-containing protein [Solidesulfovibrio carbinolicus]|uniref:Transglutaminase n=1 Tax=Solidesulfovibrio carbinolicus TaxID=296842 RepID=A0A4P6HLU1_9BACT|nr:transglutaminase domain-containing protein [Solidesulfovibrio carbinolicus]QAZ67975.1 transglutaminase [Solidesulfovibrio carbinolicus]